jgi:hypothetical protein
VTPDGQRFLMARLYEAEVDPRSRSVLIKNFWLELERLVPN